MKRLVAFLLALAVTIVPARAQYQQGQPLSALPQATLPLSGNELLYVFQKGQSRQTSVTSVATPNVSFMATGNGATASAPSSQRFGHQVNVIDDFGATGNTAPIPGTCSIAASSYTLTCPSANFAAGTGGCTGDVCKYVLIHGAGTSGAALQTTIAAVVNNTTVTLGNSASTTVPSSAASSIAVNAIGSGYAPFDTITLTANQGTTTTAAEVQLATVQLATITANSAGSGCTNGNYTGLAGSGGRGTQFTFNATVTSGALSAIVIVTRGSYTITPTSLTNVLVTGVTGCSGSNSPTVTVTMGVGTFFEVSAGLFSGTLPTSFTQASTSGSGTGATFNTPVWGATGQFTIYGNDDTAAVTAALAAAQANRVCAYFPSANYWLASQTVTFNLADTCVFGDKVQSYNVAATQDGSQIFISNTTTSEFTLGSNVTFQDLGFTYPAQDGWVSTPIVFPALFEVQPAASNGTVNLNFRDLTIQNAYSMFYVSATDNRWGDLFFRGIHAFCVNYCFDILNGGPDILVVDQASEFSSTVAGSNISSVPGQYLATYASNSGEFMHVDTSGGTTLATAGNWLAMSLVHGYRYGVRVLNSGTLYTVANFVGVQWDGVQTAFSVESGACASGITAIGGQVTSLPVATLPSNATADAISITSGCGTIGTISFNGFGANSANGSCFYIAGSNIVVNITGGYIDDCGQASITGGGFGGVKINSPSTVVNVSGVMFATTSGNLPQTYGIAGTSVGNLNISGNSFHDDFSPGFFTSTSGVVSLSGNQTSGSNVAGPVNSMTSTAIFRDSPSNQWDKPPVPTATSGWGTSPTVDPKSTNNKFKITIGSGGATNPVLTFGTAGGAGVQASAPACQAMDITSATAWTVSASTNTTVTFSGSASASDVVQGTCSF